MSSRAARMRHAVGLSLLALGLAACAGRERQPTIGLVTKTESNPFFAKMREGAQAK